MQYMVKKDDKKTDAQKKDNNEDEKRNIAEKEAKKKKMVKKEKKADKRKTGKSKEEGVAGKGSKAEHKEVSADIEITEEDIEKSGAHIGHITSKLHPRMSDYILGIKSAVYIINSTQTKEGLIKALNYIITLFKEGGSMLIVGTKPVFKEAVKQTAEKLGLPYVNERWLGGTFTNFSVILKRIEYFKKLKESKEEGKFEQLSKKEKARKEREFEKLRKKFEGLVFMKKMPEAVFICDIVKDKTALMEARIKGISSVAIVDTNGDPSSVDFPIPANDDALTSVSYILGKVEEAVLAGRKERQAFEADKEEADDGSVDDGQEKKQ